MNCGLNDRDVSLPDAFGGQALTIKTVVASGVISLALTGCGTVSTVFQDEADAAHGLRRQKTYCQSIPRVYSGLAYDFCILNAPPDPTGIYVPVILVDLVLTVCWILLSCRIRFTGRAWMAISAFTGGLRAGNQRQAPHRCRLQLAARGLKLLLSYNPAL
jgi:hypothetical protein